MLSKHHCHFRNNYNRQQCQICIKEKPQDTLDKSGISDNLSRTFDCLPHELLTAKLHAYETIVFKTSKFPTSQKKTTNPIK